MNAFASASHAHGLMIYPAIPLGCAVPALIYALTKTGAALTISQAPIPTSAGDVSLPRFFSFTTEDLMTRVARGNHRHW